MGKGPATFGDMRSTLHDYRWGEIGEERGGPIPGIREQLLSVDPGNGAYSRIVFFEPGFRFDRALRHPFWEEIFVLDGHVFDQGSGTLYTEGSYGLRPAGTAHGPYRIDLGATVLETTWYDRAAYLKQEGGSDMAKQPATFGDMRSTIHDYEWADVGQERGGPIKGIREKLLSRDPETGAYTRIVFFEPGFRFDRPLQHPFWEELYMIDGHMIDYATHTLYTKGFYALRPAGVVHGPFGTELGCTLLETTWYDKEYYLEGQEKRG